MGKATVDKDKDKEPPKPPKPPPEEPPKPPKPPEKAKVDVAPRQSGNSQAIKKSDVDKKKVLDLKAIRNSLAKRGGKLTKLTDIQFEHYVATGRCPACNSNDVERSNPESKKHTSIEVQCFCPECLLSWIDMHRISACADFS